MNPVDRRQNSVLSHQRAAARVQRRTWAYFIEHAEWNCKVAYDMFIEGMSVKAIYQSGKIVFVKGPKAGQAVVEGTIADACNRYSWVEARKVAQKHVSKAEVHAYAQAHGDLQAQMLEERLGRKKAGEGDEEYLRFLRAAKARAMELTLEVKTPKEFSESLRLVDQIRSQLAVAESGGSGVMDKPEADPEVEAQTTAARAAVEAARRNHEASLNDEPEHPRAPMSLQQQLERFSYGMPPEERAWLDKVKNEKGAAVDPGEPELAA